MPPFPTYSQFLDVARQLGYAHVAHVEEEVFAFSKDGTQWHFVTRRPAWSLIGSNGDWQYDVWPTPFYEGSPLNPDQAKTLGRGLINKGAV